MSAAGRPEMDQSCRLWSLWDMMRVYAEKYFKLGERISATKVSLAVAANQGLQNLMEVDLQHMHRDVEEMQELCDELGLLISSKIIRKRTKDTPKTIGEFSVIVDVIYNELSERLFCYIPSDLSEYFDSSEIVSDRVFLAFPRASAEIREAGTALAAGLPTACVFHAMRAAEIGTRALAANLSVSFPDKPIELAEMHPIIVQIESKIKDVGQDKKSSQRDADQKFFSEAASQFRYFKDGWRVRVMHARETYSEARARRVLDHVRDFFETLSERLSE